MTSCAQTQHVEFINLQAEGTERLLLGRIKENTSLIWLETPSNPTLRLVDIVTVVKAVRGIRGSGKQRWPLLVVDNTFLSSVFQQPLLLGADLVVHSVSKYMNGHSDVILGVIIGNRGDGLDLDTSRCSSVMKAAKEGPLQNVLAVQFVIQGVEPITRRVLRFGVQRRL